MGKLTNICDANEPLLCETDHNMKNEWRKQQKKLKPKHKWAKSCFAWIVSTQTYEEYYFPFPFSFYDIWEDIGQIPICVSDLPGTICFKQDEMIKLAKADVFKPKPTQTIPLT